MNTLNNNDLKYNPNNNQENWQIEEQELCTFLPKIADANQQPYLVNIWKTMPYIPRALPKDNIPIMLDKSVYCNDPACMPAVVTPRFEQNYRSLYREKNRNFNHRWLKHGATLKLSPWNEDYQDMFVTTRLDPSFCKNCASEHPMYNVQLDFLPHILQIDVGGGGVH